MKHKYKKFRYAPLFLALNAHLHAFEEFPDEFADFYTPRKENIKFFIAGEDIGQELKATVTIDSFKLEKDEANRNNGEDSSTICRMDHSHNNHHYMSYHVHHPLFCILVGAGFE